MWGFLCAEIKMEKRIVVTAVFYDTWIWQELFEPCTYSDRPCTRTASAMRCREGLVKVDVHHIKSHVTRTCHSEERVEICTIIIEKCTAGVDNLGYFRYIMFENPDCIGIGHHYSSNSVVKQRAESIDIDSAVRQTLDFDNLESGYSS